MKPTKIPTRTQEADTRAQGANDALELRGRIDDLTRLVSDWVWESDRDFRLTYVSEKVMEVLGFLPLELVGKSLLDLGTFPTREGESADFNWRSPFRDVPFETRDRDGNQRMFLISGLPVYNPETGDFIGVRGIAENVTERVLGAEALQRSEERFRRMFEDTAAGMMLVNLDGWLRQVNPALCKMLGYAEDEMLGLTFFDITHPDDQEDTRKFKEALISGEGRSHHLETRYRRKDGEMLWGQVTGSLIRDAGGGPHYILGQLVDITERKRAEEALRESEETLRSIIETTSEGYIETDPEAGIIEINNSFCAMLGYQRQELLGQSVFSLLDEENAKILKVQLRKRRRQIHRTYDINFMTKDGRKLTTTIHATTLYDQSGEVTGGFAFVSDITERKRAEAMLQASESRLRAVMDNSPAVIYLKDLDGRYLLVNREFENRHGLSSEEALGKTARQIFSKELADIVSGIDKELVEKGVKLEYAAERILSDGITRSLAIVKFPVRGPDESILGIGGVSIDVTEHKKAEEALRESEARFRAFAESALDRFWEMDETFRFTFNSGAPGAKFQPRPEEIIGKTRWGMYGIDPDRDDHWRRHKEDLENHRPFRDFRHSFVDEGGQTYHWSVSGTPVFGEDGDFRGYSGTARNIGERVEAEESLREAKEDAELANRAKSDFLSAMSHELRTPMNAILGFGQMLELSPKEPLTETQKDYVGYILKGGQHLLELINDVLDLTKIEAGKVDLSIENVCPRDVLDECLTLVHSMADERGIGIVVGEGFKAAAEIRADQTRFKQSLLNLMSNAIKYNRERGKVTVDCHETPGGMLHVSVTDEGEGISEDMRRDLFEPFHRLGLETTKIEGTGIGLTITKQIIERMGGHIGVYTEIGKGSTFWIELPLAEGKPIDEAVADRETVDDKAEPLPDVTGTVLYVEDNPASLDLMEVIVARIERLSMISAHNAELAIELAKSKTPDLIILDIDLPGMDGFEALIPIRPL